MKIYSGNGVSFNFSGVGVDSGKGVDIFCRIEQDEESFTFKSGLDGEVTRSDSQNRLTTVTLTVMQTSKANDLLSAIHLLDLKIEGGSGVGPLMVRDRQGTSVLIEPEASIIKFPDQEFGKEAGELEWVFKCPRPERFVGGN